MINEHKIAAESSIETLAELGLLEQMESGLEIAQALAARSERRRLQTHVNRIAAAGGADRPRLLVVPMPQWSQLGDGAASTPCWLQIRGDTVYLRFDTEEAELSGLSLQLSGTDANDRFPLRAVQGRPFALSLLNGGRLLVADGLHPSTLLEAGAVRLVADDRSLEALEPWTPEPLTATAPSTGAADPLSSLLDAYEASNRLDFAVAVRRLYFGDPSGDRVDGTLAVPQPTLPIATGHVFAIGLVAEVLHALDLERSRAVGRNAPIAAVREAAEKWGARWIARHPFMPTELTELARGLLA